MDKNGLVTITSNAGSASGRSLTQSLLTPTASPSPWSFSQLIGGIMGAISASVLVVATLSRKVLFTDDTDSKTALEAVLPAADFVVVSPTAGQTGTALEWDNSTVPNRLNLLPGDATALTAAVNAVTAPVKPKITAPALVERLMALTDADGNPRFASVVFDQSAKTIRCYPTSAWGNSLTAKDAALVSAISGAAGYTAALEVEGDSSTDPSVPKLPFEGGEV